MFSLHRVVRVSLHSLICLLAVSAPAFAQAARTNRDFVGSLFALGTLDPQEQEPANLGRIEQSARESADIIAKFVGFGIASVPLGSSSASFSYFRDPVTGELSLKSRSFGPVFAERPLTNGQGIVNLGFSYQHSRTEYNQDFETADKRETGIPVVDNTARFQSDGFLQFTTRRVFLESAVDTYSVYASVGLTDKIDLGITVPISSVSMTGNWDESYDATRIYSAPTPQGATARTIFPAPAGHMPVPANTGTNSASGIGDVVIRSKFALTSQQGAEGVALAFDVSLPTGNEEEFLGLGHTTGRVQVLTSKALNGRASAYGNGGYRFGKDSNEANYIAGVDVSLPPTDRLTIAVSLLGRSLRNAASLGRTQTVNRPNDNGVGNSPADLSDISVMRFFWESDTINLHKLATEFKLHLGGQWLATGAVLFSLNHTNMQPKPVPFFGVEWTGVR